MQQTLTSWLQQWLQACQHCFQQRLLFAGLQGSHKRGEAGADSDVDLVLILDDLQRSDLKTYRALLASLPPVRACGFLSGRQELLHWIRSDLFQFYYDTLPLYGDLSALQKLFTKADVAQAIHLGACNLYHAACHSYVFDQTADALPALFKTPFFLLQAKVFLQTGRYVPTQRALLDMLQGQERLILQDCIDRRTLPGRNEQQRDACMERLLQWTSGLIRDYALHI